MFILPVNEEMAVFSYRDNTHPSPILDNVIIRNNGAVGYSYLLAAYFQVGIIEYLLVREHRPGLVYRHICSLIRLCWQTTQSVKCPGERKATFLSTIYTPACEAVHSRGDALCSPSSPRPRPRGMCSPCPGADSHFPLRIFPLRLTFFKKGL